MTVINTESHKAMAQTLVNTTPFMSTFPKAGDYFYKISGHEAAQPKIFLQLGTNPRRAAPEALQWQMVNPG